MTSNWRDYILQHFGEPIHRLTLVADPDGLMLEEELLTTIRQRGFDLLPFDDPIAFRYAYESNYRRYWDRGQDTELAVILRSPGFDLRASPYDLLQSGRTLAFGLSDLFPRLSYPVIRDLDLVYLQPLYAAYQAYAGPELGDRETGLFVLRHVFGILPDAVGTPAALLKLLLSRHVRGARVPPRLDELLLGALQRRPVFTKWPLETLLRNGAAFLAFLQAQWGRYLATLQPGGAALQARESRQVYDLDAVLPFDEPDVRVYVDTLFLEGKLEPVSLPEGWTVESWAQVGVAFDKEAFERRRFAGLLERIKQELPDPDGTHKDWIASATRWAELTVLRHRLASQLDDETAGGYKTLHLEIEERFASWMMARYHALHSLPFLPQPVMVHHVPHYMATQRDRRAQSRLALVVVDGLALDQWRIIRDVWVKEQPGWTLQEGAVFAWVPTLTPISRQATFAGTAPQYFPDTWRRTDYDESHWRRFWRERGLHPDRVGYLRNLGVRDKDVAPTDEVPLEMEVETLIQNPQLQVLGLVINSVDNIMHGMQLGTAGMHQQVRLWLTRYRYLTRLATRLLQASYHVYLVSDHGNVEARGIGRPNEGALVEKRGERARLYTDSAFLALAQRRLPTAIRWTNVGLPESLQTLLAPGLDAFLDQGQRAVCHGGVALEEVIVPFVQVSEG